MAIGIEVSREMRFFLVLMLAIVGILFIIIGLNKILGLFVFPGISMNEFYSSLLGIGIGLLVLSYLSGRLKTW